MELRLEIKQRLRAARSWPTLVEELEREVESQKTAERLFELGILCDEIFLRKERALVHYQAAWKMAPTDTRPLERARFVYGELGNIAMVCKLLSLELKSGAENASQLEAELGLGLFDIGKIEESVAHLEAAVDAHPEDGILADALAATASGDDWKGDAERLRKMVDSPDLALATRAALRIARLMRAHNSFEPMFFEVLDALLQKSPMHEQAGRLYELALESQNKLDEIAQSHERRLAACADNQSRSLLARRFAASWQLKHKDLARAAQFYRIALAAFYSGGAADGGRFPGHLAAFDIVREHAAAKGELPGLLKLADAGLAAPIGHEDSAMLATKAGMLAWQELRNIDAAQKYFAIVQKFAPDSQELAAFRAEHPAATNGSAPHAVVEQVTAKADVPAAAPPAAPAPAPAPVEAPAPAAAPPPAAAAPAPAAPAPAAPTATAPAVPSGPAPIFGEPSRERSENLDDNIKAAIEAAKAAEKTGVDKGIDAFRKLVQANPTVRTIRRELERLYLKAERWNALIELMKEEAEKLSDTTPDEKAATLYEMITIYKERLKLDVMVVNSYNAILAIRPGDIKALDALAAQYEAMKRWPDLISTLQKRAAVATDDVGEQIALYTRIAGLYQERFSNVAEAIKAFEKVLELDAGNDAAIQFLKVNYEKRRDWEKLIAVHMRELERVSGQAERLQRFLEVAKLASDKLKKPSVSIELWQKVIEVDPNHLEALAELEKLYEREKMWEKLAEVGERQAELIDDKAKKSAILTKLGQLFSDKVNEPERATKAWRALLEVDPENKRAQDALKKLYLTQKNYGELERFYAQQNKYDEFIRVLERQSEMEDEDKIGLNLKIAELYRDRLQKADRAMRAFEKVLSLDSENLLAAEQLIPLYEGGKEPKKLAGVLEVQLRHTKDPATRQERMLRLAELSENPIKDKPAAFGWYLKMLAEEPQNDPIRPLLERLAGETGAFQELVSAYESAAGKLQGPDRLPLLLVTGEIYETKLNDVDKALATNTAILALDENHPQAIEALERLYGKTQRYSDLLKIQEKKLALTLDNDEQRAIRYRIAELFENELKDPERAVGAYRGILQQHGEELSAYQALDRIYLATSKWKELADTIRRELDLVGENVAVQLGLKFRLGQLFEEKLSDVKGAIAEYRFILDADPAHKGARESIEKRLGDEAFQLEAAAILEPIYNQLEEWAALVGVHEIQLKREDMQDERVRLLLRIGELQSQRLGDGPKAFDAYARAFREQPSNEAAREELERLATINDNWADLVALFESALPKVKDDKVLGRELLLKLADAADDKLGKSDKAVEFLNRVLAENPGDSTALELLEKLYSREERFSELLEVYRKKAELAADPSEREQILFRMAYLWEEMLHNVDSAIATYKEVLALDSANALALKALDRLFLAQKQWPALADNLSRQLELTDDKNQQVDLLVRLASLRETELKEVAVAVDTYRQVLDLDATNEIAAGALERLVQKPEHELQVATILEPVYKARNEWQRLVDVYEIMVRHAGDAVRKIELLHQIGELYELAGDDSKRAFLTYERALREDPGLEETQTRIERLARELDRFGDLVKIYESNIEQLGRDGRDPELQVALLMKVAVTNEQQLGDNDAAANAYHRVLKVAPLDLEAANALEAIYLKTDAYTKLVEVVLLKVEMVQGSEDKKQLLFRAAQIYEEVLENVENAIDVYRKVLQIDENDRDAMDSLERLYIRLERWDALKDIYAKKAELASDPQDKKQMLFVLGQVYDRELKDAAKAIDTYQGILDLDPEDLTAIQALDRLYQQSGRWYDLLQILEREVEHASSQGEVAALKFRIGLLWEKELKDLSRSVETYREVLAIDAGHEPTLKQLDGIVHGPNEPVLAAQVLEPIFEVSGEWEKLIDVLLVMVKHAEDPLRRVELLHRTGEYYERELENPASAFTTYADALKQDPQNETTLGHLERLAQITTKWADLATIYEGELPRLSEASQKVDMLLRIARVYEEELQQLDRAIATHRRVLDADQENRDATLALDRLYAQTQQYPQLADILKREIRQAQSDSDIVALQFRLGQLYEQNLQDIGNAIEVYREILNVDPGHGPTLAALEMLFAEGHKLLEIAAILEPLYRAAEQWDRLVRIHEVQLDKLTSPDDRLQMLQRIAELHEQRLDDKVLAFQTFGRALAEVPGNEFAGEEVERLAGETGAWPSLVEVYNQILGAQKDSGIRLALFLKLARVHETELGEIEKAEEAYLNALQIDAKQAVALEALDRIYQQAGLFGELAGILHRRIGITSITDDLIDLQFRLGAVYAEALDEPDKAVAAYQAVLAVDSRSLQALESLEAVYFRGRRWQELYGVYEKMVDVVDGDDGSAECFMRMAKIASDGLGDRKKSIELWQKVLDFRAEDPTALTELGKLHEQAGAWNDLVDVLERIVRITVEPIERIPLHKQMGVIFGTKLQSDERALEAWRNVLDIDGGDLEALKALAAIYRKLESHEDLVDMIHRVIEIGNTTDMEDTELTELYAELGKIEGEILQRPQPAIDAWQRVLLLSDGDFRALAALETLFTQEARWEETIDVLERKARFLQDPEAQVNVLMQAANTWEEKVGDLERATEVWERVVALDATNLAASLALEKLLRVQGRWDRLIELLLARVDFTPEASDRVAIFKSVAQVYEQEMGDKEGAFVVLQAAFRENYAEMTVSQEIERLATETNKWSELLAEYTQIVQTIPDKTTAADLWVKIGRWYGEHLGHVEYAIASVKQALQLDEKHLDALATIGDFYRRTQNWTELNTTLARRANLETEPERRHELHLQMAELFEGPLQEPMRAADSYRMALNADATSVRALGALERLYYQFQQWPELIDVLSRKAALLENPDEVVPVRLQIGNYFETRLGDATSAIASFREVLTLQAQNLEALRALERLYEKTGQMEAYLDILEQELDVVQVPGERISLHERQAAAWEEHFRRIDKACEAYEKVLLIDDRHEATYESLERLYRQANRPHELVDTLRRHINAVNDPGIRVDLYARMGQVYEDDIKDYDRAIESYNDILSFDPSNAYALAALSRLYERIEAWDRSIDAAARLIEVSEDARTRVELNQRIGVIYESRMGEPATAEGYYVNALALDGAFVPAMQSLISLYQRREDWLKASQMMVRAEQFITSPLEKGKMLYEAGRIYRDKLENEETAVELYARVIQLDPEHVDAAEPLSELYFARQKWAELEPILDMLVRKLDKKDSRDASGLYFKLARTADELKNNDKALKYYKQAYDLDSTHLPTLLGRADLLYRMEDWEGAFKIYQTILVHHRDAQQQSEIVEIFYRLGNIKVKQGEKKKALNMFEKALELDAGHRPTLFAVIDLQSQANDWEAVVHAKRALVDYGDDAEKFKVLDEISEIYRTKLANPQKAIAALVEADTVRPNDYTLLHKLIDLYSDTKQWKDAIRIVVRLAEMEKDNVRKGKYYHAAARIHRDELKSLDDAVESFNLALDAYFSNTDRLGDAQVQEYLKAFEALEKICTNKRDFKMQERNYRKMLKRMPTVGLDQIKIALWHALGEIYRSRLKEFGAAIQAFEVAAKLDPENLGRHEILAELYAVSGPDFADKAIEKNMLLIRKDPFRVDSYKALRRIFMDTRKYDRAWNVCAALAFLQRADADEMQFYEQYKPKGFQRSKGRITDEMWVKNVFHQEEDRYIGAILGAVWQGVGLMKSGEHKQFGLKRKEKHDILNGQEMFSKVFVYVASVLGVQMPEVYFRPGQPGGMQLANTREKSQLIPSIVVGADLLQGRSDKELAYQVANYLTMLRPEHYIRRTTQTNTELGVAFQSAIKLVNPNFPVPPNLAPTVDQYVNELRKTVQPAWIEQLGLVVQRFLQGSKGQVDLQRWSQAVDLTAQRAGFILSGDLGLAARFIQAEPATVGGLSAKDKIKELVLYSISEEYFELREQLGLTIS